ncbi:MAG: TonB-dependent receptor [Lishizhenia sp.]
MMKLLALLPVFILASLSFSQDYTIRGFVYDSDNGEPVVFAKVLLQNIETEELVGTDSDLDGYFSFAKLGKGTFKVTVRTTDYEELNQTVTIDENTSQIVSLRFDAVKPDNIKDLEGVNVYADDINKKKNIEISTIKLDQKGLERLPSFGAENDIISAFAVTPGVVTTGDQGGQIYVRGGTPIQNKILLDGMTIYNPFHSIGFFSVFETELVKSADIYTGGFDSRYGGRVSSIMDITYRDGNTKKFSGKVSASPFMAKAVLEGPLFKPKDPNSNAGAAYMFSVKKSLLELTSPTLYPYTNDGEGLPFDFTDLYGKVTFKGDQGSKVSVFGFNNRDRVNYPNVADLNWKSTGGGLNFLLVPSSSPIFIKGHLNASTYDIFFQEDANSAPRTSQITGFDLGFDFTYFLKNNSEVNYGISLGGFDTNFETYNEVNRKIELDVFTPEIGAYVNYRIIKGRWVLQPGVRLQRYGSETQIEPRMGAKINATENFRLKFSGGRYSQNFTSAESDRDVVTLFYGFLSAPTNVQEELTKPNGEVREITHGLQIAWHGIGGFELDITKELSLNVEGYYKFFPQLANINNNKIYEDSPEFSSKPDELKKEFLIEQGYAYGADFLLKYTKGRVFLWGVYSYGKTERWDGFKFYTPVFDRRHNVNLVATYAFGKKRDLEVSMRWNLGTGLPFTATTGYFQGEQFLNGITTDITTSNPNEVSLLYGEINTGRLPTYHRFDITVKKNWAFKNKTQLEGVFGITNVYDRDNIFYVNRVTNEKIPQLPILPSIGVSYKW